jgi:hypothetical protein
MSIIEDNETFSVWQFLRGDISEKVREDVSAKDAVLAAHHYCHNVAAVAGITRRVIIVDGSDTVVFEWLFGQGVVYPTPDMRMAAERDYGKRPKNEVN